MSTHVFDQAIVLTPDGDNHFIGATSPAYANMVGPFGGITAATVLNAVMQHPSLLGEPLSLTINYCAAVADGAFAVTARPVRTNRSTQHWTVAITQPGANGDEDTVVTATVVTAARRETWSLDDEPMPQVVAPGEVQPLPLPEFSAWLKRYEMRPIEGPVPSVWDGSGTHSRTRLWLRDAEPRQLDLAAITGYADAFFPRVWLRRAKFVPAGTVPVAPSWPAARSAPGCWARRARRPSATASSTRPRSCGARTAASS